MTKMHISLPETPKNFSDQQVTSADYGTSSEYVRELIRCDQGLTQRRNLLMEGAQSPPPVLQLQGSHDISGGIQDDA